MLVGSLRVGSLRGLAGYEEDEEFSKAEEKLGPFLHDTLVFVETMPNMPSSVYVARSTWPQNEAVHVADI